jgi:ATP-dependent Clp protease ATP-binding subunit ClpA
MNITQGWEMNRRAAMDQEPLVLIFTGDTGVGKTETSYRFGNGLLSRKVQRAHTRAYDGHGFLNLRGEQFSADSQAGRIGVHEVQRRISLALVELLEMCHGRGVVVFDEVQKVVPGALDVFLPMIEKRGALSVFDTAAGKWKKYSTENMVIIFTTDVGGPRIRTLMLKYGGRDAIPADVMQNELHKELNATWGGNIKKFVKGIVPFMPLGNAEMKSICIFTLSTYGAKLRGKYWHDFVVDDAVADLLADSDYLYEKVFAVQGAGSENNRPYFYKSTLGARGLENGAAGT